MSQPVPAPENERSMSRTYALVVACHVTVIAILWWVGHTFSR